MTNKLVKHENRCELFGTFGFFIQFILGIFSFTSLICKILKYNNLQ